MSLRVPFFFPPPSHLYHSFSPNLSLYFPFRFSIPPFVALCVCVFFLAFLFLSWQLRFPPFPSFYHRRIRFVFVYIYVCVCTTPSPSWESVSSYTFFPHFFSHTSSISVNVFQSNDVSSRMKTNFPFPVFVLLLSICARQTVLLS